MNVIIYSTIGWCFWILPTPTFLSPSDDLREVYCLHIPFGFPLWFIDTRERAFPSTTLIFQPGIAPVNRFHQRNYPAISRCTPATVQQTLAPPWALVQSLEDTELTWRSSTERLRHPCAIWPLTWKTTTHLQSCGSRYWTTSVRRTDMTGCTSRWRKRKP